MQARRAVRIFPIFWKNSLHNERFDLDEDALVNGAAFYVQYVLDAQEKFGAV